MSVMIEIYFQLPLADSSKSAIDLAIAKFSGEITFEEIPGPNSKCWTVEFAEWDAAESCASALRIAQLHVEGPCSYGTV